MPSSSDSAVTSSPPVHENHYMSERQLSQVPDQARLEMQVSPIIEPPPHNASTRLPAAVPHDPVEYESQLEVITASALVAIKIQFLTSGPMAITTISRVILSTCIILELLGVSLAICLAQDRRRGKDYLSPAFVRYALRAPTVMILAGIAGLGVTFVLETFEMSPGAAVIMSALLAFGVVGCLSVLLCGWGGWGKEE